MVDITIEYYEQINNTPAVLLAEMGHVELLKNGLADHITAVGWDDSAIVAFSDNVPIGVITFQHTKRQKRLSVAIGYVKSPYRGCGVYRTMWNALVEKAKELKAKQIIGITTTSNIQMRDVAKKLGRTEHGIILKYEV